MTVRMKNPVHPGEIVRYDCLEPLGLSVTDGAKILGVTRQALNNVVNCKAGISPEMAIRLEKAFGSTAETWLANADGVRPRGSEAAGELNPYPPIPATALGEGLERPRSRCFAAYRIRIIV